MDSIGLVDSVGALGIEIVAQAPVLVAAFAATAVAMAFIGWHITREPGLVARRLGAPRREARGLEDLELAMSFRDRILAPIVAACSRLVLQYTPTSTIEGYRRNLRLAGQGTTDVRDFLGRKGLLAGGFAGAYLLVAGSTGLPLPPTAAIILAIVGFYVPNIALSRQIGARQKAIRRALPDTLDLLTICVEAGLGFDAAMARVVDKRSDELSAEFGRVLSEMRVGRSRRDAMRALAERTDVTDVNTFVSAIIQSEQLGVSISKILSTQSGQMRVLRRQRAQEMAQKAPIKMLFPMVFLIFPAIFVVVLGPALPGIFRSLSRA